MKKISVLRLFTLLAVVLTTLSCNRGVGCPTNFSLENALETVANLALSIVF